MRNLTVFLILLVVSTGCGGRSAKHKKPQTAREYLSRYAKLTFSKATDNEFLREELFRIEAEGGLPLQLACGKKELDASQSANVPLQAMAAAEQLSYLDRRLAYAFPESGFTIAERHASEIARLSADYQSLRLDLDRFSKSKKRTIDLAFDEGSLFGNRFIPCLEIAIKLELTVAGLALRNGDWKSARTGFERVWRSLELIAAQPHLESRVLCAQLRSATLRLLETMLNAPECDLEEVHFFRNLLAATIEQWPNDDRVWRGERARALHFFEMMRDGQALSLADEKLQAAIDDHGGSKDFGLWLHAHIDEDELFYLDQMRKLIDSCAVPFADRNGLIAALYSDLQSRARTDDDPLLSRLMLFDEVEPVMRWQASDRLRCEVMLIALEASLGERTASLALRTSPVSGRAYHIGVLQRIVRVDADSEAGEFGYAVSTPRYDLQVVVSDPDDVSDEQEVESDRWSKTPQKSARRLP